jgi:hypothetical protein
MHLRLPSLLLSLAASLALGLSASAQPAAKPAEPDTELARDAGRVAISNALAEAFAQIAKTPDSPKRFAVLPVQNDTGGYFSLQVRNLFSSRGSSEGFELYTRTDAEWNNLLKEIAWGENYADTMSPETVQKFGKIKGVEGLMVGTISGITSGREGEVRVRFNLQVFQVETGRVLWATEKTGSAFPPKETENPLALLEERGWFSKKIGLIAGGVALGLILLGLIVSRMKAAARPR